MFVGIYQLSKSSFAFPTNTFQCCRVGLRGVREVTVVAKVAAYLHPVGLQRSSGSNEGVGTEEACLL